MPQGGRSLGAPVLQSNLVCDAPYHDAYGIAYIKPTGDLFVELTGVGNSSTFGCRIVCDPTGTPFGATAGCGTASAGGHLKSIVPRLGSLLNLGADCLRPFVHIIGSGGEECFTGFVPR